MAKYICKKKCFYNNTLWEIGSIISLADDVKVPKFFKPFDVKKVKPKKKKDAEPKTLAEVEKKDAEATLKSINPKKEDKEFLS